MVVQLHRYCTGFAPLRIFAVWRVIFAACVFLGKEQLRQRFEGGGQCESCRAHQFQITIQLISVTELL